MINPLKLEEAYKEFSENFSKWVPDGIMDVNLSLLQEIGLLNCSELDPSKENITQYFQVIETAEKVTLYNEQFGIWIVPQQQQNQSVTTLTFIALLTNNRPHLELVFSTTGVYNSPKFILKILQHFLSEVIDNEAIISSIGKKQ